MTVPMETLIHQYRKATIEDSLRRNLDNLSQTARELGIHRNSLSRWLRIYQIKIRPYKRSER